MKILQSIVSLFEASREAPTRKGCGERVEVAA